MKEAVFAIIGTLGITLGLSAFAQETPSAYGAMVYFVNRQEGAVVTLPVKFVFDMSAKGIARAGTENTNTGHDHLLISRTMMGKGQDGMDELI